jgi:hypothetical protein
MKAIQENDSDMRTGKRLKKMRHTGVKDERLTS